MSGKQRRQLIIMAVTTVLVIVVVLEAGALYKMVSMIARGESPRQVSGSHSSGPLDLTGEWVQTNSRDADAYQAVNITDQTIDVYWISESEGIYTLYWSGTYTPPSGSGKTGHHWTSQNDTARTSTSRRGSQAAEKEFTCIGGKLIYEIENETGGTETVEAERRAWGYSAQAASAPAEVPQGERFEGAGDIGDYHIEITGMKKVRDADGAPAALVTYTWTNNSTVTASAMVMLLARAYQGDVRLFPARLKTPSAYDTDSCAQDVPPGGTASVQEAYQLVDEETALTFEVTEFISHTKNAVTQEFEIT